MMKALLSIVCMTTLAFSAGPAFAEVGIDVSLGASVASHSPYDIFELHYSAVNFGAQPELADFTVTLLKNGEVIGSSQFETLLPAELPYTQDLQLPISGSVPADVYILSITASLGSASDEARAGIILDEANNVTAFGPPDPIVAVEHRTWGAIKELFR